MFSIYTCRKLPPSCDGSIRLTAVVCLTTILVYLAGCHVYLHAGFICFRLSFSPFQFHVINFSSFISFIAYIYHSPFSRVHLLPFNPFYGHFFYLHFHGHFHLFSASPYAAHQVQRQESVSSSSVGAANSTILVSRLWA